MSDSDWGIIVFGVMIAIAAYTARGKTRNLSAISKRDWIIYVGVSLLLVLSVILYAEFTRR